MRREAGSALGALAPLADAVEALVLLLTSIILGLTAFVIAVDMVDALLDQRAARQGPR